MARKEAKKAPQAKPQQQKGPSQGQQRGPAPEESKVIFQRGEYFDYTAKKKIQSYPGLAQKLIDFRSWKAAHRMEPFGSSDKPFRNDGKFAGLRHAHLTHDISIIYSIEGTDPTIIKMHGVCSHDELGTGQPAQPNKQIGMGKKLKNQTFV